MRCLYVSCHSVLEYDEVKLFSELGHDVFSCGVYSYPYWRSGMARPGIPSLTHYPELERLASTIDASGGSLPDELIQWADVIIWMHRPEWLEKNWAKVKHKRNIFRSIGQSLPHVEDMLKKMRQEGLQIVRYSPLEQRIARYAGEDAIIRFYVDGDVFKDYNGNNPVAINITQSIRQRAKFCHYNEVKTIFRDIPHKYYGNGNEDLGQEYGGQLSFEDMIKVLQDNRVFVYGGTWPAAYTLSLMEAMAVGIPVVSIGRDLAERISGVEQLSFFEIPELFENERNILISDNIEQLRHYTKSLLNDLELAKSIGNAGREMALTVWGKETIRKQWREFIA